MYKEIAFITMYILPLTRNRFVSFSSHIEKGIPGGLVAGPSLRAQSLTSFFSIRAAFIQECIALPLRFLPYGIDF
jgi:hypothetical protein